MWEELTKTALLGTERAAAPLPPPPDPALADVLPRAGTDGDRDAALLSAVAVLSTYRRAGRVPATAAAPSPPPPAPRDDRPRVSVRSAVDLWQMLAGENKDLLSEWLGAVAAAGKRVPEETLPDLLDHGRATPAARDAIVAVMGTRGAWLAAQNPAWSFAAGAAAAAAGTSDDSADWETGTRDTRLPLLKRSRATDPANAREMLALTWPAESPEDRAAYLATFEIGLTAADEPFLEQALDDRRKEVRTIAGDLLGRLPESQFVVRMKARLPLTFKAGRKPKLDVEPPRECDKAMQRDGIDPKAPTGGQKAWWIERVIGSVPPSVWTTDTGAAPTELIAAADASEWKEALLKGWARAAARTRDAAWAEALIALRGTSTKPLFAPTMDDANVQLRQLAAAVPAARRETIALAALSEGRWVGTQPLLDLLRAPDGRWSAELTRAVLENLRSGVAKKKQEYDYDLFAAVAGEFPRAMDPLLAEESGTGWPEADKLGYWRAPVEKLIAVVTFRRDMLREITS